MIIGITGKRCSGKNEVALILSRKGFKVLDFTDRVLGPILKSQGKPVVRENLAELAMSLRAKKGRDILARMLCEGLEPGKDYVISGIRFREEVEYLRKRFGRGFALVSVVSGDRERYGRSLKRRQKGEERLTFREFMDRESLPTELVIPETMAMADFVIENTGTRDELERGVLRVLGIAGK